MARSPDLERIASTAGALSATHRELDSLRVVARSPDDASVRAALPAVLTQVRAAIDEATAARGRIETRLARARKAHQRATGAQAEARRLHEAARKVEQGLVGSLLVDTRIKELRASLWRDNLERLVDADVEPKVRITRGAMTFELDANIGEKLRATLDAATRDWITAVLPEVGRDVAMLVHEAWTPIEGDLPVDAPSLAQGGVIAGPPWDEATERAWWTSPAPPTLERTFPLPGWLAECWRHTSRLFLGSLMLVGLFGGERSGWILLGVLPLAIMFASRERRALVDRRLDECRQTMRAEVRRWVEGRLDRVAIHLRDHLKYQFQVVLRERWRGIYKAQITPKIESSERDLKDAAEAVREAEAALREARPASPELGRFLEACEAALGPR